MNGIDIFGNSFIFVIRLVSRIVFRVAMFYVRKATKDLEDIDNKRKDEFKNYEMEKEHLRKKEMEQLDEAKRAEEQKKFEESKKKHANHPDVHHPVCVT